jgi:ubiquinone/menaquinone biosynthesis C-methylase UbiE
MTLERVDVEHCGDRLQVLLHRARYDFVLSRLAAGQSVLEIGTGAGTLTRELLPRCASYIGVEYDFPTCLEALRKTEGKAAIIEADARKLPFQEDQFSFIVCLEVLEHLGDYQAGVRSIYRCLHAAGRAVISVPYRRVGGKSKNEHHLYEPGEAELVSLLKRLFRQVEVYYQYFEETPWMTVARKLHFRRLVGLDRIYANLSAGLPEATSRISLGQRATGMKLGLMVVAIGKNSP